MDSIAEATRILRATAHMRAIYDGQPDLEQVLLDAAVDAVHANLRRVEAARKPVAMAVTIGRRAMVDAQRDHQRPCGYTPVSRRTEGRVRAVISRMAEGLDVFDACRSAGISPTRLVEAADALGIGIPRAKRELRDLVA